MISLIKGKVGFIFSEESYVALKKQVESEVIKMPAKAKIVAPQTVWIKSQQTSIDPG